MRSFDPTQGLHQICNLPSPPQLANLNLMQAPHYLDLPIRPKQVVPLRGGVVRRTGVGSLQSVSI